MKRIIVTLCMFFGLLLAGMAQTTTTKADDKAAKEAQKKADKEKKKADAKAAKEAAKSTGTNKDGSPDMRLKKNKDAANAKQATTPPPPAPPKPAAVVPNPNPPKQVVPKVTPPQPAPAVKTTDKVISTDDKGRTIYEGPRGGHYYINKNGNKEYIKKG